MGERRPHHRWSLHEEDAGQLRSLDLFASLCDRTLGEIVHFSKWLVYEAGREIMRPGRNTDTADIIVWGRVSLSILSADGRVLTFAHVKRADFFEVGVPSPTMADQTIAEAMEDGTTICSVPWTVFLRAVLGEPLAAREVIERLRVQRRSLEQITGEMAHHDVPLRVRHVLHRLAMSNPEHVISYTDEHIGRMAGTSVHQASRVIAELRRRGKVLRQGRSELVIPEPEELF